MNFHRVPVVMTVMWLHYIAARQMLVLAGGFTQNIHLSNSPQIHILVLSTLA